MNMSWWLYLLIVAASVFLFGFVLYSDVAYAAGLVAVPALISGLILWRGRVTGAFVVLIGILVAFGYDHFGVVREDAYQSFVSSCVTSFPETHPQVPDETATLICTCLANEISDDVFWQVTRDRLLFRETPPINENDELLPLLEDAWSVCLP